MLFRLVSPMQRSGSKVPQFVQRIPADVRTRAVGLRLAIPIGEETIRLVVTSAMASIRVSLRTQDLSEAKIRQGQVAAYMERVFAALRTNGPVSLTHRQATALAGELYRSWADTETSDRTLSVTVGNDLSEIDDEGIDDDAELIFAATVAMLDRAKESDDPAVLERMFGAIIDRLLLGHGIAAVDAPSRRLLLNAFWLALRDAMEARGNNAAGNYAPDPKANRFPVFTQPVEAAQTRSPVARPLAKTTLAMSSLLAGWWKESEPAGLKPSTYVSYSNTIKKFIAFVGHDDAHRVSPEDVIGYKDYRLTTPHPRTGKTTSGRTVRDSDLVGLKSVFGWGVRNRLLQSNPADDITIKLGKKRQLRQRGFNADEVQALLSACLRLASPTGRAETNAAKRWIPWVLAYTGARVGEIAQLRKEDVEQTGDHWSLTITPEAGTVKGNAARVIPLHPHLVELGFVRFVGSAPSGHLFLRPNKETGDVLGPLTGVKNRVREFVREYITDPNVQPNHAWRHLFMTRSRAAGVDQELRRMITGHTGAGVDEQVYGDPAGLYREVCKLPKFAVST
jgi:integrase